MYLILPVSKKLQAFSLPPSLELALLPSESIGLLKLRPGNIGKLTYGTSQKESWEIYCNEVRQTPRDRLLFNVFKYQNQRSLEYSIYTIINEVSQ